MSWTVEEKEEVKEIKDAVLSLDRAARGHNGNLGFLAEIEKNKEFRIDFKNALAKVYWSVLITLLLGLGNLIIQVYLHLNAAAAATATPIP